MKYWSLCVLVFTMTADVQGAEDASLLARLNASLVELKSLSGLPDGTALPDVFALGKDDRAAIRKILAEQNPDQDRVMLRYADTMAKAYRETVIPWDVAYTLTSVLAGKDLTNENLTPLTAAILTALDSAFDCRKTQSDLPRMQRFQSALATAYHALRALNVSAPNARVAVEGLAKAGKLIWIGERLVRPIAPEYPVERDGSV